MSEREIRDRIAAIMARTTRPIAGRDTFVTWNPGPVLYHTVSRDADSIVATMVRNDPLVGRAVVRLEGSRPVGASIAWWEGAAVRRAVTVSVSDDSVVVTDTTRVAFPVPSRPWAIADYGMDDLLLPALGALPPGGPHALRVFRPYGAKWDELSVEVREIAGGREYELWRDPADRQVLRVASSGRLLQVLQSKFPNSERRPLELSRAVEEYRRLRRSPH